MVKLKGYKYDEGLQTYFDQIKDFPLLTFEEELQLSRSIQDGDGKARCRLIEGNLRLVIKIARGYSANDVSLMDLIQEGNMGLMRAADKYDHGKNVRFSTYAAWWIRQSITRFLSNKRRTIRLPHRKEELLRKIQQAYYSLRQIYMRQPRYEELAAEIGIPVYDVEFLLNIARDQLFLEHDKGDLDSMPAMEFHEDYTYSPERALMKKTSQQATLHVLDGLKDREKNILIYRYQLNGGAQYTLKNIGEKMGLSIETVRQIEIKALKKLRTRADELRFFADAT